LDLRHGWQAGASLAAAAQEKNLPLKSEINPTSSWTKPKTRFCGAIGSGTPSIDGREGGGFGAGRWGQRRVKCARTNGALEDDSQK